jgi:hypothetical protein
MNNTKTLIIVFLFVIAVVMAFSNSICSGADFELWTAAGIRWDPNDNWRFTFQEAFRFDEEGKDLYYKHTDIGATYKGLADWLDVSMRYRGVFGVASDNDGHIENRPYLQMGIKGELLGFHVSNRNRLEYRERKRGDDVWRYRAMLTINEPFERIRPNRRRLLKDTIRPYVSDELYFDLNDGGYDRNRLYGGISCKVHEHVAWNIYYLWQSSKSSGRWEGDLNVVGTTVTFLF